MVERAPNLSPPSKPPLWCIHLVRLRGVLMRRREAGPGCGARGSISQDRHPGGAGAPPGSTTRPCQELADDREVYSKRDPSLSRGERIRIKRRDGPAGHLRRKRGPAPLNHRDWRAERRPRVLPRTRHHRFALFGAPSPSTRGGPKARLEGSRGDFPKLRTLKRVAARRTHVWS